MLVDSTNAYRYKLSNNDEAFNEQLPFYVVKPLYTSLAYLAYKAGFSLSQATLVPSFISYLLIGLLLFHWLSMYLRFSISFFVSLLIIFFFFDQVAKLSTPIVVCSFTVEAHFILPLKNLHCPLPLCACVCLFLQEWIISLAVSW